MKLALIDLDNVLVDNTARVAKAEKARQEVLALFADDKDPMHRKNIDRQATTEYWHTMFTPDLVALDVLMDGAADVLRKISEAGYRIIFLTSRPEHMRQALHFQ